MLKQSRLERRLAGSSNNTLSSFSFLDKSSYLDDEDVHIKKKRNIKVLSSDSDDVEDDDEDVHTPKKRKTKAPSSDSDDVEDDNMVGNNASEIVDIQQPWQTKVHILTLCF